jgi:hypothetical protein
VWPSSHTRPVDGESGLDGPPGCRSPKLPSPMPRASILPRLFSCRQNDGKGDSTCS